MRDAFHEDLDRINDSLVEMAHLASSAISRATRALLDADLELAEQVISSDQKLDDLRHQLDATAIELLARQQPVATDLRIVITAMQMGEDIERMGDLAAHVAKVARLRYPESAVPAELRSTIGSMGSVAEGIIEKVGSTIAAKNVDMANELVSDDDEMDDLHRQNFAIVLGDDWHGTTLQAVDATLVSRYFERFSDHAVSVGHRVVYLVTGIDERLAQFQSREEKSILGGEKA